MTDIVERLREMERIVSGGGWIMYLPDNMISDTIKNDEKFKHLRFSNENTFAEAADTIEQLKSMVDRMSDAIARGVGK